MKALMIVLLAITWSASVCAVDHDSDLPNEKNLAIGQDLGAAVENGDTRAWAMLCATEQDLSPRVKTFCDKLLGAPDNLRAATFTGCALATQTVARVLIAAKKSQDAIDYYQKASIDFLNGAKQLVSKDEFKAILDDETRKLRASTATNDAGGAEMVLQKARQCAKALDDAS